MLREWRFERTTEPEEDAQGRAETEKKRSAGLQQRLKQAGAAGDRIGGGVGSGRKGERDPLPDPGAGPPVFQGDQCLHAHRGGTPAGPS